MFVAQTATYPNLIRTANVSTYSLCYRVFKMSEEFSLSFCYQDTYLDDEMLTD